MPELTLAELVAVLLALSLNAYVLLGGADFGGGVWDLLARGPRRARQREVIAHAIGPIWEANHVWLILAIVLAFTCFSPVFARIMTVLHIPVSLMLIGIVLRGSAFTFRTYDDEHDAAQRRWGRIFSIASLLTPVLLGVCIGAVASGRVLAPIHGTFAERFVEPWLTPFALGVGLLTLTLFAFLAAVFLTMETRDPELVEDFRRKAIGAAVAVFLAAGLVLLLSFRHAPLMTGGLVSSPWALPLHLATGLSAIARLRRALASPLRARTNPGGPPGLLHLLGVDRIPVPLPGASRSHDRGFGGTAGHAQDHALGPCGRHAGARAILYLPLSGVQEWP